MAEIINSLRQKPFMHLVDLQNFLKENDIEENNIWSVIFKYNLFTCLK